MSGWGFTTKDKYDALLKEVQMREEIYLRQVGDGRMSPVDADRGIAVMQEIAHEYKERLDEECGQARLF